MSEMKLVTIDPLLHFVNFMHYNGSAKTSSMKNNRNLPK